MPRGMGPYVHLCVAPGCRAWGAYGFNGAGVKREAERWYCRDRVPPGGLPWVEARQQQREGDVF